MKTTIADAFKENCSYQKLFEGFYSRKAKKRDKWLKGIGITLAVLLLGILVLKAAGLFSFIPGYLLMILALILPFLYVALITQYNGKADIEVLNRHYGENARSSKARRQNTRRIRTNATVRLLRQFNMYEIKKADYLIKDLEDDLKNLDQQQFNILSLSSVISIVMLCIAITKFDELHEDRYFLAGIILLAVTAVMLLQFLFKLIFNDDNKKNQLKDQLFYFREARIQLLSETPHEGESPYSPGHLQETW